MPLLGLVWSALACGAEAGTGASVVRDSAGIVIVENAYPAETGSGPWSISDEPLLDIGVADGPEEYQLYHAYSAVRRSDGTVVVANGGTNELRFYDAGGRHLYSVGRTGEGPGEFTDLQRLWLLPGDSLLAYDFWPSRLSVFDSSGEFVRTLHVAAPDGRQVLVRGPLADGSLVASGAPIWNPPGAASGVVRDSVPYYRYDARGTLIGHLGLFPSGEVFRVVTGDRWTLTSLPFPRVPVVKVAGERFHFGPNEAYEILTYTPAGDLERRVRLAQPRRAVTPGDIDRFRRDRLERAEAEGTRPSMQRLLNELPVPEWMPPYERLELDAADNLWVADYRPSADGDQTWKVFSPNGEWLGTVELPGRFELLQIGPDFVLGRWTDEMEVEHVQVYDLTRR